MVASTTTAVSQRRSIPANRPGFATAAIKPTASAAQLFVSYASTASTGVGGMCTGSLVGSGTVLTAAHRLSSPNDRYLHLLVFALARRS